MILPIYLLITYFTTFEFHVPLSPLSPVPMETVKIVKGKQTKGTEIDPTGGLTTMRKSPESRKHFVM